MSRRNRFREKLMSGQADKNIEFSDLSAFLRRMEFEERIEGDHHIFFKRGIAEIINLQPRSDGAAKPYQVKQVRDLIFKYKL